MAKNHDKRQVSGDQPHGTAAAELERAKGIRVGLRPRWPIWQRPDGNWGPCLTVEARAQMEANRANPNG